LCCNGTADRVRGKTRCLAVHEPRQLGQQLPRATATPIAPLKSPLKNETTYMLFASDLLSAQRAHDMALSRSECRHRLQARQASVCGGALRGSSYSRRRKAFITLIHGACRQPNYMFVDPSAPTDAEADSVRVERRSPAATAFACAACAPSPLEANMSGSSLPKYTFFTFPMLWMR